LRITLIAFGKTLRAEVVGIAEWFVDALKRVVAGHEDLDDREKPSVGMDPRSAYPFKGRRAGPRMSSHEDGLARHREGERFCSREKSSRRICIPSILMVDDDVERIQIYSNLNVHLSDAIDGH
jgi:hypothetical protein